MEGEGRSAPRCRAGSLVGDEVTSPWNHALYSGQAQGYYYEAGRVLSWSSREGEPLGWVSWELSVIAGEMAHT